MEYAKGLKPTWKIILNCSQTADPKYYFHLSDFVQLVNLTGYSFFEWNGKILEIQENGIVKDTGWLASEID